MIVEPMAHGHLLKSSGRVLSQGQQVFYELLLNNAQHLLKFYDSTGRVRLVRPVLLPAQRLEVHGVGEYLLCYQPAENGSRNGSFFLVRLSNVMTRTEIWHMGLRCSHEEEGHKIRHTYCSLKNKRIVFSDAENNVYLVNIMDRNFEVKYLYKHQQEISGVSIDEGENLVIVNKDGGISIFQFDQKDEIKVPQRKDEPNVVQYFHGDGFVVHYATRREWRNNHQEEEGLQNYFLLINEEDNPSEFQIDKFYYEFSKDSEILIKSGRNYLIVFNKTQNIIITVHNGLQRVTEVTDNLMSEIEYNNFVVNFKVDESFNVLLEIRVFVKVQQEFTLHQYEISKKQGISHKNYLKRNLHNIFQFNGLIYPLYQAEVKKELNNFINSLEQYKNSKESRMLSSQEGSLQNSPIKNDISPFELSSTLFKVALQHFPGSLDRLIRKIRCNIQFNKNICYIETTCRFFELCHSILEDYIEVLVNISRSIDDVNLVNGSLNSRDKEEIDKIYVILQNMINFLFGLISALRLEISDQERMDRAKQANKKQQERLAYYERVYNVARSFFLVATMLEDEQILTKFDERFQKIRKSKESFTNIYKTSGQLVKLQYEPLFLHEHFELIHLLPKQEPSFTDLIKFMLSNRQNFVQNAYFYQSITKNASTPYLQTDTSDLIENICFHLPLMRKESLEGASKLQETKQLLSKMTGTVLKLNSYPFMKYMIQVNVCYQEFRLAIMLIFSDSLKIPGGFQITEKIKNEHLFMIKSLILCSRIDFAQIYVLDHYDIEISEEFLKYAKVNGNIPEVMTLFDKRLILTEPAKLKQILEIEDSKWNLLFGERLSQSLPNSSLDSKK